MTGSNSAIRAEHRRPHGQEGLSGRGAGVRAPRRPFPSIEGRGFKVATSFDSVPFDPDTGERVVTPEEIRRARQFVRESFPALADQPILESRVCQYETSVDAHFIVDRHPDMANAWIVGGGSGHGYKHGIMLGDYVARRVTGEATDPELDATFRLKDETY